MKKILLITVIVVIVIASLSKYTNIFGLKKFFNSDQSAVVQQIVALNRIETASFNIEKIIEAGSEGNLLQNILFGDKILLIAHGQVIAGFDLSKVTSKDIEISGSALNLKLPAPEILVTKLDGDKTRVYDRKLGWLTKGDSNLETEARTVAEQEIRRAACESKIFDFATENLKKQFIAMFQGIGFQEVNLSVATAECK